jgi:lincosamide nucleotidyltransferase
MFEDGIYAEVDVFTPTELGHIDFPEGRIVWKAEGVDEAIRFSQRAAQAPSERSLNWMIGEVLTNLYVGLGRYHRGEKLSALRFIQGYAMDRVLQMAHFVEAEHPAHRDAYGEERRFEQRFPAVSGELSRFMQGYDGTPESALAILDFLERHFAVDPTMKQAILKLMPAHIILPDERKAQS